MPPLLFVLALEPFLFSIRNNTSISGFTYGDSHLTFSAHADDILFVSNPESSIPTLLTEFSSFSLVSGYKLNPDKTASSSYNLFSTSFFLYWFFMVSLKN